MIQFFVNSSSSQNGMGPSPESLHRISDIHCMRHVGHDFILFDAWLPPFGSYGRFGPFSGHGHDERICILPSYRHNTFVILRRVGFFLHDGIQLPTDHGSDQALFLCMCGWGWVGLLVCLLSAHGPTELAVVFVQMSCRTVHEALNNPFKF